MNVLYNLQAPKKPTNLSLNSDLVEKAKEEKINLSSVVEYALAEELKRRKEKNWKNENKNAILEMNSLIDTIGFLSDEL